MIWKIKELRDLINSTHGESQLNEANDHINSVVRRIQISAYHLNEAKVAVKQLFDKSQDKVLDAIIASTNPSTDQAQELRDAQLKAEANLIACAHSTHSIADIMAYAILYSVNISDINNKPLNDISKKLRTSDLKNEINKLLGLNEFCYLNGFVNTIKHRCLVPSIHSFHESENNNLNHELKFNSFNYKKAHILKKVINNFLKN